MYCKVAVFCTRNNYQKNAWNGQKGPAVCFTSFTIIKIIIANQESEITVAWPQQSWKVDKLCRPIIRCWIVVGDWEQYILRVEKSKHFPSVFYNAIFARLSASNTVIVSTTIWIFSDGQKSIPSTKWPNCQTGSPWFVKSQGIYELWSKRIFKNHRGWILLVRILISKPCDTWSHFPFDVWQINHTF